MRKLTTKRSRLARLVSWLAIMSCSGHRRSHLLDRGLARRPSMPQSQACRQEHEIAQCAAGGGDRDHRAEVDERLELADAKRREADGDGQAGEDHPGAGNLVAVEQALQKSALLSFSMKLDQTVE